MLVPSRGPSLNVAVIVGPISAACIAWEGFSNSVTVTLFESIGGSVPPADRTHRSALQALAERAGDGVGGRAHPELGLQAREPLADGMKAQEELPREFGLAFDDAGRAQHLALARRQAEPVERVRVEARHLLLEQQSVRIAGEQADGEAPAVALADQWRARRQREPLRDRPGQPSGMVGLAEVLGQPTPGLGAGELDLAIAVEQHHRRARRRIVGERADEAPARLRGPQRTLEPRAGDVEHVAVALGELAFGTPEPGDDRLAATGAHADRDLVLHAGGVPQVAVELAAVEDAGLHDLRQPQGRAPAGRVRR